MVSRSGYPRESGGDLAFIVTQGRHPRENGDPALELDRNPLAIRLYSFVIEPKSQY